jgi:hypothetical protein
MRRHLRFPEMSEDANVRADLRIKSAGIES